MKHERYKVKSISEIIENSAIILALKQGNKMVFLDEIDEKQAIAIIDNYLKTDLNVAQSRHNFIISKNVTPYLKEIFNNQKLHSIILSEETLTEHRLKHPEITANDYYFVLKSLENKPLANFKSSKNNQLFYYDNQSKVLYRVAIKTTKYNEIFIKSVTKGKNIEKELKRKQRALQEP